MIRYNIFFINKVMGKQRSSCKLIKKTLGGNESMADTLDCILNPESAKPEIIITKYEKMFSAITKLYKFLYALGKPDGHLATCFTDYDFDSINAFGIKIHQDIEKYSKLHLLNIKDNWKEFRETESVKDAISIYSQLIEYRQYLDTEPPTDTWIKSMSIGVNIFEFTRIDLALLWGDSRGNSSIREFILNILSRLYKNGKIVYDEYTTPDIDVDEFSANIMNMFEMIKNVPELSRCKNALNKLQEGADIFKSNIGNYYKDFAQSKNPMTFVESFVSDVASDQSTKKHNANIIFEFNKLRKFISNNMKNAPSEVKSVMSTLDKTMDSAINSYNESKSSDEPAINLNNADDDVPDTPETSTPESDVNNTELDDMNALVSGLTTMFNKGSEQVNIDEYYDSDDKSDSNEAIDADNISDNINPPDES